MYRNKITNLLILSAILLIGKRSEAAWTYAATSGWNYGGIDYSLFEDWISGVPTLADPACWNCGWLDMGNPATPSFQPNVFAPLVYGQDAIDAAYAFDSQGWPTVWADLEEQFESNGYSNPGPSGPYAWLTDALGESAVAVLAVVGIALIAGLTIAGGVWGSIKISQSFIEVTS